VTESPHGAVEQLLDVLEKLPFVSTLKRDIQSLRSVLYERRAPRIAAVGRPGSGRSRLGNALLGKDALPTDRPMAPGQWLRVDAHGSRIDWLEIDPQNTQDTQDTQEPSSDDDPGAAPPLLDRALAEAVPDVVLVPIAPRELDDHQTAGLDAVSELLGRIGAFYETPPPIIAVLSRVDEVPPATEGADPWPEEKLQAIDLLRQRLEAAVRERGLDVRAVLAASAAGDSGIEELSTVIFAELPETARLEGARALGRATGARRGVANQIVHSCSTLALTIGLAPVPLSDAFIIAPLQVVMVSAIAHLGGGPWDRKAALEWIGSMGVVGGTGMGLRWTAQQLAKLIPGAGTLVSAGIAGAGTATLGQGAIAYFLGDGPKELPRRASQS